MTPRTARRIYLREARIMVAFARVAVRCISSSRLLRWVDRPINRIRRFAIEEQDWVAWAIEHTGHRADSEAQCLPRALAAHAMLRRRGIASSVCLGVARDGDSVSAHAWIEVGGRMLIGGETAPGFTRLAVFGGAK